MAACLRDVLGESELSLWGDAGYPGDPARPSGQSLSAGEGVGFIGGGSGPSPGGARAWLGERTGCCDRPRLALAHNIHLLTQVNALLKVSLIPGFSPGEPSDAGATSTVGVVPASSLTPSLPTRGSGLLHSQIREGVTLWVNILNFHYFPPQVFQAEKGDEKAYYESGVEWPDSETHPGRSLTGDLCCPGPPQTAMEG